MILSCSSVTVIAHDTKNLSRNLFTAYWNPELMRLSPLLDWQVISTGLLRGMTCCLDILKTSTDPLVSLKL